MDGGVAFLDNLHFLDSQIGKVDQDGQIEIWKSIQSTIFYFYQNISLTKTLKSGLLRYTIEGIMTDKMNRPKN